MLAKILQRVAKFIFLNFARLTKFHKGLRNSSSQLCPLSCSLYSFWAFLKLVKILQSITKLLDVRFLLWFSSFLDWFRKGFEALQNLDSSCNLASILICHGLYQVLPHSWLVLIIKKLPKTPKLAKN